MLPALVVLLALRPGVPIPPAFPKEIPLPPGAKVVQAHDGSRAVAGRQSLVLHLEAPGGPSAILAFYREALPRIGAKVQLLGPTLAATLPGYELSLVPLEGLGQAMLAVKPEGGTFAFHRAPAPPAPVRAPLELPPLDTTAWRLAGASYPGDHDPGALLIRQPDGSLWGFGAGLVHPGEEDLHGQRYVHKRAVPLAPTRLAAGVRFATLAPGAPYGALFWIDTQGTLHSQGADSGGRLGQDVWDATLRWFKAAPILPRVRFVAAGPTNTAAITEDGGLWVWGSNLRGQVPGATGPSVKIPRRVLEQVVHVAVAREALYAVRRDGTLWGWGAADADGFLDGGVLPQRDQPHRILEGVRAVYASGNGPVMVLKQDGSLWTWGENSFGQCGQGHRSRTPARPAPIAQQVVKVALTGRHAALLKADGSVWTWGWNWKAHCGFPPTEPDILKPRRLADGALDIAVTTGETYVLKRDGSLWGTGNNRDGYGLLGEAEARPGLRPVPLPGGPVPSAS